MRVSEGLGAGRERETGVSEELGGNGVGGGLVTAEGQIASEGARSGGPGDGEGPGVVGQ